MPTGGDGTAYYGEEVIDEKVMTKKDIKKRDEIADAISDKDMKDRYGDKSVKYAIATKIVMDKKKKKKEMSEALDKDDKPFVKHLVKKLRKGSKTHAKQADDLEKAMKENTAIESELVIQDWNSDDIKFTEIETVDIIKAKPLKENIDLYEGFKARMVAKFGKTLLKNIGKINPFTKTGAQRVTQGSDGVIKKVTKKVTPPFKVTGKEAMKMKRTGSSKLDFPIDKVTSQNIQTKSIINQAKKANELAAKKLTNIKSSSGKDLSKPIKVNLQKKIDFDKYIATTPNKIQKKFGSTKPTGTFTDDLPPVKTEPLTQAQKNKIKKIQKNIDKNKNKKNKKEDNPNLMASYDWRAELDEDWQKVNRQDKTDGLSKKAVKAYRRENPGSKLQTAVTTKPSKLKKGSKSAKRRLSFCRRMKGMKKKLTSAKTARDPDSRINKALRRWNC